MSEDTTKEPLQTESVDLSPEVETPSEDDLDDILSSIENEVVDIEDEEETDNAESVEEESEPEEPEEEAEDKPEVEPEEAEKEEPVKDDSDKRYNDEMARRRIAEKELKQERDDREKETLNNYLKDAQDDDNELAKRQAEVDRYSLNVEKSALMEEKLSIGLDRAKANIDLLQTGTADEKDALLSTLDDYERMYIVKDKNGRLVQDKADVYQFLTERANTIKRLTRVGATQQAQQKRTQSKKALVAPSRSSPSKKIDPDLAAFDKAFNEFS